MARRSAYATSAAPLSRRRIRRWVAGWVQRRRYFFDPASTQRQCDRDRGPHQKGAAAAQASHAAFDQGPRSYRIAHRPSAPASPTFKFTLLLTIALVVGVIFLFLRKLWATVIPAVAVPLSLIGTFAVMYVLGFSLDNLSLMALTIAVGFVVDDAVVMIENIVRHIEGGATPMEAALAGAGEIGFTIVSISISLIAVFIPLFLMGGMVGLLFREFAVTVAVSISSHLIVSLTLTPMMSLRLLSAEGEGKPGYISRAVEALLRQAGRALRPGRWWLRCATAGSRWPSWSSQSA